MPMDYEASSFWLTVGLSIYSMIMSALLWLTRRDRATNERVEALEQRTNACMAEYDTRIACAEVTIRHLPSNQDIKGLSERLDTFNRSLAKTSGRLEGVNRAVDLMNEFLINEGKK